ncbi:MAG: NlpC/P60 family protein [Nitrospiraceae bacterium]
MNVGALEAMVGVPFEHGARVAVNRRTDCYGVVVEAYRRRGIAIPDPFANVQKEWGKAETFEDAKAMVGDLSKWKKLETAAIGCVVLFSRFGKAPDHVGVMLDQGRVLHCLEKTGVVIQPIDRLPFQVMGFYDYQPA